MNQYQRDPDETQAAYDSLLARLARARAAQQRDRERDEQPARGQDEQPAACSVTLGDEAALAMPASPPGAAGAVPIRRPGARVKEITTAAGVETTTAAGGKPSTSHEMGSTAADGMESLTGADPLVLLRQSAARGGTPIEAESAAQVAMEPAAQPARAEIECLRAQLEQARIEMLNMRRRGEQDKAESLRFAASATIAQLLPLIDDFERAVAHMPAALRDDPWVAGVVMINNGLHSLLKRQGVERIAPWQAPFDPYCHEAISRLEDSSVPENTVIEVYRPGYSLHGRVLRPAQVQVAVRGAR